MSAWRPRAGTEKVSDDAALIATAGGVLVGGGVHGGALEVVERTGGVEVVNLEGLGGASEVRRLVLEIVRERSRGGQCALGVFQRRGRVRRRLRRGWRVRRGAGGARRLAEGDDRASPDADARANPRRGDARARATPRAGAVARPSGRRTEVDDEPSEPLRIAKNEEYPIGPAGRSARGATHRRLKSPRRRFGRVTPIEAPRPTASLANIGSVVRSGARAALSVYSF